MNWERIPLVGNIVEYVSWLKSLGRATEDADSLRAIDKDEEEWFNRLNKPTHNPEAQERISEINTARASKLPKRAN